MAFTTSVMLRGGLAFMARTGIRQISRVALSRSVVAAPATIKPAMTPRVSFDRLQVRTMMSAASGNNPNVRVRAQHILVKDKESAELILKRVKDGEDFGELAMFESSCPSKQQGGDLGWFGRGQMVPEFDQFCFTKEPGTIGICETNFGWHVIQVVEKARLPVDLYPLQLGDILGDVANLEDYQLLDVREKEEVAMASIKNANFLNLPISDFQQWGPKVMAGEYPGLEKGKKTVVLCHHGGRSMQVASFLSTQAGFKDVFNVAGGIHQYSLAVDSSIPTY